MIKKKLLLLCLSILAPIATSHAWLKVTNRDLAVAGATAGVVTVGSYIYYRLSSNYKIQSAKQQLEKYTVHFMELHNIYEPYKNLTNNPSELIDKVTKTSNISINTFFNKLRSDLAIAKTLQTDLEKLQLMYKKNSSIESASNELLNDSVYPCIKQLSNLSAYIYDHLGYFMLESTFKEVAIHFKQELLVNANQLTNQQVATFARISSLSAQKTYPYPHYVTHIVENLTKLTRAIHEFEKTEGKNQSIKFYVESVRLEGLLTTIKNALVKLPDYASQLIEYEESRRKEALVTAERKKAEAAVQQVEAERRKVELAKKQLQEDKKSNILKEQLLKQREKAITRIEDIQYTIRNLRTNNPAVTAKIVELQKQLETIKGQLSYTGK